MQSLKSLLPHHPHPTRASALFQCEGQSNKDGVYPLGSTLQLSSSMVSFKHCFYWSSSNNPSLLHPVCSVSVGPPSTTPACFIQSAVFLLLLLQQPQLTSSSLQCFYCSSSNNPSLLHPVCSVSIAPPSTILTCFIHSAVFLLLLLQQPWLASSSLRCFYCFSFNNPGLLHPVQTLFLLLLLQLPQFASSILQCC
ncbi:hypothetical protein BsWGS_10020 [Bradybaena similaris]